LGLVKEIVISLSPQLASPLSQRLREETAQLHRDIEGQLGFPDSVQDLAAYGSCLVSYFRLYFPIESSMAAFDDWQANGIQLAERLQAPRLIKDLMALQIAPASCAEAGQEWLPPMPDFAHALGVFYVLEGSTLGGQFILRRLQTVLGEQIKGADAFFSGHAAKSGAMWNAAKHLIDAYGEKHPERCDDVIAGAVSAFHAVGRWMAQPPVHHPA